MSLSVLSPEAQLLLLAAGGARNDARIRELAAGALDWEKLGWLAERERAAPVLWERLQSVGAASSPAAEHLQRLAMVSEFRMLHLEQRLRESLEALARAGVEVMLLKGAALAVTVYGSFVRRPMVDLDLLVRAPVVMHARAVLLDTGWTTSEMEVYEEFFRGHHHLPALDDARGTGVRLELHTSLFFAGHPFRLSIEDLWARSERVSVGGGGGAGGGGGRGHAVARDGGAERSAAAASRGGAAIGGGSESGARTAYIPSPHDQLLHLCLHFAWSHMMATGAWRAFRDLEAILTRGGIAWDEFTRLAVESRGGSCCYWTFRLANRLAGVAIPEAVMVALRPPLPRSVLDRVERHFIYHLLPTESLCPSVSMAYTMWCVGVRPGWSGHGAVRPWDRADEFLVNAHAHATRGQRVADQLRNIRGWARYVRSVMFAGN